MKNTNIPHTKKENRFKNEKKQEILIIYNLRISKEPDNINAK